MSTTCLQLTLFTDELPAIKRGKLVAPKWRKKQTFVKVEKFLEDNDDEKITVGDLVEKMEEYLNDAERSLRTVAYENQTSGQEYFGDNINITDVNGKPNVVTFKTRATAIL